LWRDFATQHIKYLRFRGVPKKVIPK
jgi:hypothetical protein